jgi:hypothetical protein
VPVVVSSNLTAPTRPFSVSHRSGTAEDKAAARDEHLEWIGIAPGERVLDIDLWCTRR